MLVGVLTSWSARSALAASLAATCCFGVPAATAQEPGTTCSGLALQAVDTTRLPLVRADAVLTPVTGPPQGSPAITVEVAGRSVPVTVQHPQPADLTVAVVVTAGPGTSAEAYAQALTAARELLVTLPADAQIALVSGVAPGGVVAPLAVDRTAATDALTAMSRAPVVPTDSAAAVDLAVQQVAGTPWPAVLVLRPRGEAVAANAVTNGVAVTSVGYAGAGTPAPSPTGCERASAVAELDQAVGGLLDRYRLQFSTDDPAATVVRAVRGARVETAPLVPGAAAGTAAAADPAGASRSLTTPVLVGAGGLVVLLLLGAVARAATRRTDAAGDDVEVDVEVEPPADAPVGQWRYEVLARSTGGQQRSPAPQVGTAQPGPVDPDAAGWRSRRT